ncbi:unnamed protein product, partial [Dibothriocephalus latus]
MTPGLTIRLGFLACLVVTVFLLIHSYTSLKDSQKHWWSMRPDVLPPPATLNTSDVIAERMICSSKQPYDIALCLPHSGTPEIPPLAELPCRRQKDLIVHGGHKCISFSLLRSQPPGFWAGLNAGTAFQLYPVDLPAEEV